MTLLQNLSVLNILDYLEVSYLELGPLIVFFSNFIEISPFGWLIPGGTLLALSGFFAYNRPYYLIMVIIFGWFGAWTTFVLAYFLGAKLGKRFADKLDQSKRAKQAEELLKKHGPVILTTSMLASLTRFWVAFASGANNFSFKRFLIYSSVASFTWTVLMVSIGYLAGSERKVLEQSLAHLGVLSWVLLFIALFVIYLKIRKELLEVE